MNCRKCNTLLDYGDLFCGECGKKVSTSDYKLYASPGMKRKSNASKIVFVCVVLVALSGIVYVSATKLNKGSEPGKLTESISKFVSTFTNKKDTQQQQNEEIGSVGEVDASVDSDTTTADSDNNVADNEVTDSEVAVSDTDMTVSNTSIDISNKLPIASKEEAMGIYTGALSATIEFSPTYPEEYRSEFEAFNSLSSGSIELKGEENGLSISFVLSGADEASGDISDLSFDTYIIDLQAKTLVATSYEMNETQLDANIFLDDSGRSHIIGSVTAYGENPEDASQWIRVMFTFDCLKE